MTLKRRLDKAEPDVRARYGALSAQIMFLDAVCEGLQHCKAGLDEPTYSRVEKILTQHAEEVCPWLVSERD
jgi:hypothetical protein